MKLAGIDGGVLEFASDRLKDDKDVLLKSVSQAGWTCCYASENLRNDKDVLQRIDKDDYWYYDFIVNEDDIEDNIEEKIKNYLYEYYIITLYFKLSNLTNYIYHLMQILTNQKQLGHKF